MFSFSMVLITYAVNPASWFCFIFSHADDDTDRRPILRDRREMLCACRIVRLTPSTKHYNHLCLYYAVPSALQGNKEKGT